MQNKSEIANYYREGFSEYKKQVEKIFGEQSVDILRIETQFEALKDWSLFGSLETVKKWYSQQKDACAVVVEDIPLDECRGWYTDRESGWIRHESGEFFYIQGIRVSESSTREVGGKGWDQPILTQVGYDGGLLGILRKRFNGVPHYLVEAKMEPGNCDLVQISPTLQATFSNLKRAHSGRKPRFAEYFESPDSHEGMILYKQWMSEDGGRLHKKRNMGMLVEIPEKGTLKYRKVSSG